MLIKVTVQNLKRLILTVSLSALTQPSFCQSYSYDEVVRKSDSSLQAILPKFLWPAAKLYNSPYYRSLNAEEDWLLLERGASTQGKLQRLTVMYEFVLKQTSCTQYKNLHTLITMHFDSNMQLMNHTGTEAIPDFVLNNMPCPFISFPQLKEVLRRNHIPDDVRMRQVSYNAQLRRFEYLITGQVSMPSDTSQGKQLTQLKTIMINAETGEVIENNFDKELTN